MEIIFFVCEERKLNNLRPIIREYKSKLLKGNIRGSLALSKVSALCAVVGPLFGGLVFNTSSCLHSDGGSVSSLALANKGGYVNSDGMGEARSTAAVATSEVTSLSGEGGCLVTGAYLEGIVLSDD